MKYAISLFFISSLTQAFPIHIFHEDNASEAEIYRKILMKDYMIPEDLIVMKKAIKCEGQRAEGKLDLCLKNNGDLIVVSVDREFINESLKVFQAP